MFFQYLLRVRISMTKARAITAISCPVDIQYEFIPDTDRTVFEPSDTLPLLGLAEGLLRGRASWWRQLVRSHDDRGWEWRFIPLGSDLWRKGPCALRQPSYIDVRFCRGVRG